MSISSKLDWVPLGLFTKFGDMVVVHVESKNELYADILKTFELIY